MRIPVLVLLFLPAAWAQPPAPITPANPVTISPGTPAATAPVPATPVTADTVVAEIDGKKYTAGQIDSLLKLFPPQMQTQARADLKRAVGYVLMIEYLAGEAEKASLDKKSPLKETLEYQRMGALSQAEIQNVREAQIVVSHEDEQKYYNEHPEQYREAKVKAIYVTFSAAPVKTPAPDAKKTLTEAEAKAKIEDLRKQIVAGADFGKVAKENSDDKDSAAKDGDFGTIKHNSPYSEPLKKTVFELKPGGVSEPIRQPNGFYLIKLEEMHNLSYDQVRTQIYEELKQKGFNEFMQNVQKRFEVKVENPSFFAPKPAGPQTR